MELHTSSIQPSFAPTLNGYKYIVISFLAKKPNQHVPQAHMYLFLSIITCIVHYTTYFASITCTCVHWCFAGSCTLLDDPGFFIWRAFAPLGSCASLEIKKTHFAHPHNTSPQLIYYIHHFALPSSSPAPPAKMSGWNPTDPFPPFLATNQKLANR